MARSFGAEWGGPATEWPSLGFLPWFKPTLILFPPPGTALPSSRSPESGAPKPCSEKASLKEETSIFFIMN